MSGPNLVPPAPEPAHPQDLPWLVRALVLIFLARALERLTDTTADPDLWGYLAFGRLFWQAGRFPYQDVFAYLPTLDPWVYHEWLTGVLFYPLYQALGAPGLQALKYVLGLITLWLIYATARRRGSGPLAAILALFLVQGFLALGYSPVRAQVFTYVFFPLTLYLLETARLSGRFGRLWLLLPIQAVWANLHGGFLAGLGLIPLYSLGEALCRRPFLPYARIFILAGLATLINPYGLKYWSYLVSAVTMPRPDITEWVSVWGAYQGNVFLTQFFPFMVILVLALVFFVWARWRELTPILVFGLTIYLGLRHLRHLVFSYMVLGAFLPSAITPFLQVLRSDSRLQSLWGWVKKPALVLGLLGVGFYAYQTVVQEPFSLKLPPLPQVQEKSGVYYPMGALAYIKDNNLKGNLLTEYNWGEYLIWVLYPACRVSPDGRYETVYPPEVCHEFSDFLHGRAGWRKLLEKYPPDMILIDSRSKLYTLLKKETSWRQVYHDPGAALFVRK